MMRFTLFGPVLLACLVALAGLWGALDAYAQGLAIGAITGGLAALGPMLLIGRGVQQDAALDEWEDEPDAGDELPMLPPPALPALPPPPAVRVVSVERPQQKQLTTRRDA